jgi:hypothetical protein
MSTGSGCGVPHESAKDRSADCADERRYVFSFTANEQHAVRTIERMVENLRNLWIAS